MHESSGRYSFSFDVNDTESKAEQKRREQAGDVLIYTRTLTLFDSGERRIVESYLNELNKNKGNFDFEKFGELLSSPQIR